MLATFIVGKIQKAIYKGKPINSFEPFAEPKQVVKENGQYYVTEIQYGVEYPNSYLDITYPTENTKKKRPTVIYFHGGGFFGGDKSMGDPLAVDDDANRLFEEIVANGYNFVNVNYALVPDCHFPVPFIQMNQAIDFLVKNGKNYGLDMENVTIFGQSAGAVLTGQFGALLCNPEYAKLLDVRPAIAPEAVKALVIDDAPFIVEEFRGKLKLLMQSYFGMRKITEETARKYNAYAYISEGYRPTFLTAGNTDGFPRDMEAFAKRLKEHGVEHEYFFVPRETCELPHGYLNMVKTNPHARECFDHIIAFMNRHSGVEDADGTAMERADEN